MQDEPKEFHPNTQRNSTSENWRQRKLLKAAVEKWYFTYRRKNNSNERVFISQSKKLTWVLQAHRIVCTNKQTEQKKAKKKKKPKQKMGGRSTSGRWQAAHYEQDPPSLQTLSGNKFTCPICMLTYVLSSQTQIVSLWFHKENWILIFIHFKWSRTHFFLFFYSSCHWPLIILLCAQGYNRRKRTE